MKVILTGVSGFIGAEILSQCLSHPSVTSIIAISRRQLPLSDPKLQIIILSDFSSYPPALLSQLGDAEACIYAMGTGPSAKPDLNRRVNMDYTLVAANAFATSLGPQIKAAKGKSFKFVYCSGYMTERDQKRPLWIVAENRKMRGLVETRLMQLGRERADEGFEVVVARPASVCAKDAWLKKLVFGAVAQTIVVDQLAAAMIGIAVDGAGGQICENNELVKRGESSRGRRD